MRKLYTLLIIITTAILAKAQPAGEILSKEELMKCPEKMGSVYFAYPNSLNGNGKLIGHKELTQTAAPEGYSPFYISHYGRHGSRFQPNDARYKDVLDIFEDAYKSGNLTALGEDVLSLLHKLWIMARGNGGQLSAVGVQQHREIARRMLGNFPEVFASHKKIEARSSVVPRCKASMEAFCGSLQSSDNAMNITMETKQEFMNYIAYDSPEQKALEKDTALWRGEWLDFEKTHVHGERLLNTLFKNPNEVDEYKVTTGLYWLAIGMQDLPTLPSEKEEHISLIELFLPEELYDIWLTINYRMYVCNADAPIAGGKAIDCARPLLKDILDKAERAIKNREVCADLRFGHDSHLIRLLSLLKVEGCDATVNDLTTLQNHWQDFYISPMAANLQVVFYTNKKGNILVKFLHNENEVALPIKSATGKYYRWKDVKKYVLEHI